LRGQIDSVSSSLKCHVACNAMAEASATLVSDVLARVEDARTRLLSLHRGAADAGLMASDVASGPQATELFEALEQTTRSLRLLAQTASLPAASTWLRGVRFSALLFAVRFPRGPLRGAGHDHQSSLLPSSSARFEAPDVAHCVPHHAGPPCAPCRRLHGACRGEVLPEVKLQIGMWISPGSFPATGHGWCGAAETVRGLFHGCLCVAMQSVRAETPQLLV